VSAVVQSQTGGAPAELWLDYAAGVLEEGPALLVATQLCISDAARRGVAAMEEAGGALLAGLPDAAVPEGALERAFERIDRIEAGAEPELVRFEPAPGDIGWAPLPAPLRRYFPRGVEWSRTMAGLEEAPVKLRAGRHQVSLMRIAPNRAMPEHVHRGAEYTLVLSGGFRDSAGSYGRGDVCVGGGGPHQPIADDEGCVCLAVSERPADLTGWAGLLLNPWLRWRARR
jgi:putative transcriptional regulator